MAAHLPWESLHKPSYHFSAPRATKKVVKKVNAERERESQISSGDTAFVVLDILWRSGGYDPASGVSAARPHVDHIVGIPDHIQIVLNDNHRCTVVQKRLKTPSSTRTSSGCSPMDGSSNTKTESSCVLPISLASLRRCASPPDRLGVSSPSVR